MSDKPFKQRSLREAAGRPPLARPAEATPPDPAEFRIVGMVPVGPNTYRVTTESAKYGRVTQDVACFPEAAFAPAPSPAPPPQRREGRRRNVERLPHGSVFGPLTWDAEKQLWSGTLEIPGMVGDKPVIFAATAGGVFRLLETLDQMFRDSLAGGPTP